MTSEHFDPACGVRTEWAISHAAKLLKTAKSQKLACEIARSRFFVPILCNFRSLARGTRPVAIFPICTPRTSDLRTWQTARRFMTEKKRSKYETNRRRLRGNGLSHLDIAILHFLWRWKLSTAAVLHATLAGGAKASSFNKRLRKLCANGFIEPDIECAAGFHYW